MKRMYIGILALLIAITFTSCEKPVATQGAGEVSFNLNNPYEGNSLGKKGAMNGDEENIPVCNDELVPNSVHIEGLFNGLPLNLDLDLILHFEGGTQTVVVKLDEGLYTIDKFEVLDASGEIIYASPLDGSYYDELYGFDNNVVIEAEVKAFKKSKYEVDVLCWRDYSYKNFGYVWFDYNAFETKTLCFFGDICTKFYDEWHSEEGSPYANQEFDGYDFPAIFTVEVQGDGWTTTASNLDALGEAPVCVEYLDNLEVENEAYTADIWLHIPSGDSVLVGSVDFTDADWSDAGVNPWGGEDGIYEFNIGDCKTDVDSYYQLPWIPVPDEVTFNLYQNGNASYFGIEVEALEGYAFGEIEVGSKFDSWCGNKDLSIGYGSTYKAKVYPWYDALNIPDYAIDNIKINKLNYIANKLDGLRASYSMQDIQNLIWNILEYDAPVSPIVLPATDNYIIPLGGYAVVFLDPYERVYEGGGEVLGKTERYQMVIVSVDP